MIVQAQPYLLEAHEVQAGIYQSYRSTSLALVRGHIAHILRTYLGGATQYQI